MARDLHKRPFQEHTKNKLRLFYHHTCAWLSVFVQAHDPKKGMPKAIRIYDFFSGPGKDETGEKGSPLLILQALQPFADSIRKHALDVRILFNDSDPHKIRTLKNVITAEHPTDSPWKIEFENEDFSTLFAAEYPSMANKANLILLDQHGVRHFTESVFKKLRQLRFTDTLIFMSSSFAARFKETPAINLYLNAQEIFPERTQYYHVHRALTEYFRSLVPGGEEYYLIPYSFKSGPNIFGIIFACGSAKGAEKFLEAAWKSDTITGEANYAIDFDCINPNEPGLWPELDKPKKFQAFELELESKILNGEIADTADLYRYGLHEGFLPKHIRPVLRKLTKEHKIDADITGLGFQSLNHPKPIRRL